MDETEVTNAQFAKFIQDTKYVTEAETFGWSFVFVHFIPQHVRIKVSPLFSFFFAAFLFSFFFFCFGYKKLINHIDI